MQSARVTEILVAIVGGNAGSSSLATRLCEYCAEHLAVTGVGLALMNEDGANGIVAATTGPAREMEELQFSTGEGPCLDASRSGRPVLQPDLLSTAVQRWPAYGPAVLAAGIRAVFAFPLQVGAVRIGALDLYRDKSGALSDADLADALHFADAATLVLLHLQEHSDSDGDHDELTAVMDGRAKIHQATGMISVQLGVSLAEALLQLRAHAYAMSSTVADIAADVVDRRLRFDTSASGSSKTAYP